MTQRGGAERVNEAIAEIFPDAPIFSILYSAQKGPASLASRVTQSPLRHIPGAIRRHRWFFPLFPGAIESFDLSDFDVIISSHHTAAKGILRTASQLHICYCHTPMRALWERSHAEVQTLPGLIRPLIGAMMGRFRVWDYSCAARVDHFVANSFVTQQRIRKHYGRDSVVITPPIDVERFTPGGETGDYYLVVSRPVPYKRIDIAISAARRAGRKLIVTGGYVGSKEEAGDVEFRGHVSDEELVRLMRGARALLFPQYEDFGMTPLEVNACGVPVIAYGAGGALETVVDGKTGILVPEQSVEAFAAAIERFERMRFDSQAIRRHAELFSKANFARRFRDFVLNCYDLAGTRSFPVPELSSTERRVPVVTNLT